MLKRAETVNKGKLLYFPLGKLGKDQSIFKEDAADEFLDKFKPIFTPILGKQLALNTYYENELIAMANTAISMELLRQFDRLKINFEVNYSELSLEEKDQALNCAMTQIIKNKEAFRKKIHPGEIPGIQSSVHEFITSALARQSETSFQDQFETVKGYLEFASRFLTSKGRYIDVVASLKHIIEKEQKFFKLSHQSIGETLEHSLKTTWISLILAEELDDFGEEEYKRLSVICMAHDCGKAVIPEAVIYKRGRLTQLEQEIMKSHVLFSYILFSNNQKNPDFNALVIGLHHIKENKNIPLSYGILPGAHTSFSQYLSREALELLDQKYHQMVKYHRLMSIADTFEAITASRVYKKPSSIGKTIEIMLKENRNNDQFYTPYLDTFINALVKYFLPKNLVFKISDEILDNYFMNGNEVFESRSLFKKQYRGVIVEPSVSYSDTLLCMVYNRYSDKVKLHLDIFPVHILNQCYFT